MNSLPYMVQKPVFKGRSQSEASKMFLSAAMKKDNTHGEW
jgi:hypothetical protein